MKFSEKHRHPALIVVLGGVNFRKFYPFTFRCSFLPVITSSKEEYLTFSSRPDTYLVLAVCNKISNLVDQPVMDGLG